MYIVYHHDKIYSRTCIKLARCTAHFIPRYNGVSVYSVYKKYFNLICLLTSINTCCEIKHNMRHVSPMTYSVIVGTR